MQKRNKIKAIVAFAVALAFILPTSAVFANDTLQTTTVSIDPLTLAVEKYDSFTVDVYVVPGEPISGVQADLSFDPTLIQAVSVVEGDIFSGYSTWFSPGTIDNIAGTITYFYNTILDPVAVSDPGVFVTISFTALDKLGTSPLDLDAVVVIDYDGDPVTIAVTDGSVTVEEFFDLAISVDGSGTTVPTAGVHSYPSGQSVGLTATEDLGWTFDSWTGPDAGEIVGGQIIMTKNMFITAYFTEDCYDLVVTPVGSGHVDVVPDKTCYLYSEEPVLTAVADPGWTFKEWGGDLNSSNSHETIIMDDDKAVTATFTEDWYILTITIVGTGTVGVTPAGPYRYVDPVILDPVAGTGWSFSGWSGLDAGEIVGSEIIMTKDMDITATFQEEWFIEIAVREDIPGGMADWVTFGESMTASDGLDGQDVQYPVMPPDPYVVAFFKTDFVSPFDKLEEDIRHYPGDNPDAKVWELWVLADDAAGGTTEIAMTWDLVVNEYDYVGLFDYLTGDLLVDMKDLVEFDFTAPSHGGLYRFNIICSWNHIPVAVDDHYTINENAPLIVGMLDGVLSNDIDEDGPLPLTASVVTIPLKGALVLDPDGSFTYTPITGATGTDSFVYEITDGYVGTILHTDQATVHITIIDLKEIDVNVGWNLISMPAYEENFDKTNLIIEDSIGVHHTWADAINTYILEFTYGWDAGAYVNPDFLTRGDGYWLWAIVDCTILVPSNAEAEDHITTFDDGEGWYLVGAPYTVDLAKWDLRIHYNAIYYGWSAAIGADIIQGDLFDWDRGTQNYVPSVNPDFFASGYGYWMYVYETCSLTRA